MFGLSLSLSLGAGGRRALPSPATLFSDGRPGAFFDFSTASQPLLFAATAGETPITDGATIALALGKRADDPLGANLGAELLADPEFNSAAGWTLPAGITISGGAMNLATPASFAIASVPLSGSALDVFMTTTTISAFTSGNVRQAFRGAGQYTIAQFASAVSGLVRFHAPSANFTTFEFQSRTAADVMSIDRVSVKRVPARVALQATAGSRPTWYSAVGGHCANDGTKSLVASFPAGFTADVFYLGLDGTITELLSQAIGTSFTLPQVSMKCCVIAAMSADERDQVRRWMSEQGPFS